MKAVTYFELALPRCVLTYGVAPCGAVRGYVGPGGELAAVFDGTNDYMRRVGGLTGAADSSQFTFEFWFRAGTLVGNQRILSNATALAGATERLRILLTGGTLGVAAFNSAGTLILNLASSALTAGKLYHVVGSFDLSDPTKRHLIINRVPDIASVGTYTNDNIDFTVADWAIGATPDGSNKFNGQLGELWFMPGLYVDLSRTANLEKFVSLGGNPVALGSDGSLPSGTVPLIFVSSPTPDTAFNTNKGSGGNFTVTGALTAFAATGIQPCFNSATTCQDLAAFSTGKMQRYTTVETVFNTDATAHLVAMPPTGTVKVGDLLMAVFASDGSATVTTPAGWTSKFSGVNGTAVRLGVYVKDAVGTEGGTTVDFVTSAAEKAVAQVFHFRAQEWDGNIANIETAIAASGATLNPDPPSLAPTWGGDANNYFVTALATSAPVFISAYPTLFSDFRHTRNTASTTAEVGLATAARISASATLDPGLFTLAELPGGSVIATIVIKGAAVVPATVRFSTQAEYSSRYIDAHATIIDDDYSPAIIGLGTGLGERSQLTMVFGEAKHPDVGPGYDPYLAERWYDPYRLGSHWGKWRSRWAGMQGVTAKLYRGFAHQELGAMEQRTLFVESMSGPTTAGIFSVTAKDALKFLDGDRAQAPAPSTGRLNAALDAEVDPVDITLAPAGVGVTYKTSGYVAIGGNEIVAYTRSGDVMSIMRGAFNTPISSHNADDRVQEVLVYAAQNVANIIADLEINYAGVPPESVPITDWLTETTGFLSTVYSGVIAVPTPVKQLVTELCVQSGLMHYWDDLTNIMRLQVLRQISASATVLDEKIYMLESLTIDEQPGKRVSRALTFFGLINPLEPIDKISNYRSAVLSIDPDAELKYGGGVPAIAKIYSRWIADGGLTVAAKVNELVLQRFGKAPMKITMELMRGALNVPALGGAHMISAKLLQNEYGERILVPAQITSLRADKGKVTVVAEEQRTGVISGLVDHEVTITSNQNNVNLRTKHDLLFSPAVSGDVVKLIIQTGVVVGSNEPDLYAVDTGTWPAGVIVEIYNNGKIQGAGGKGGRGTNWGGGVAPGQVGEDGGTALRVRHATNYYGSTGAIHGGGGGGGGGAGTDNNGGGGGGGAGTNAGDGGRGADRSGGGGAKDGKGGTATEGGAGGNGGNGATGVEKGGNGGDPGQPGASGGLSIGGDEGNAIEGVSLVTFIGAPGDILGPQVG